MEVVFPCAGAAAAAAAVAVATLTLLNDGSAGGAFACGATPAAAGFDACGATAAAGFAALAEALRNKRK